MPRQNTPLFQKYTQKQEEIVHLNAKTISKKIKTGIISYEAMSDLLRETNDAQFGIVSTLQANTTWLRDATNAIPLAKRIPRDSSVIEANNALLRCLSRLRPIEYAIEKKMRAAGDSINDEMRTHFSELTKEILDIAQSSAPNADKNAKIKEKEKEFNTFLIKKLHDANLTKGCNTQEQAEKLLFHYRNLSSVISPARPMVTLTYDSVAQILQRETQYPVTKKTEKQKHDLAMLKTVTHLPSANKNSHNTQKIAFQEANNLFADLLASDDRALGAQARKSHLIGVKNAFIVKNELIPRENEGLPESPEEIDDLEADPENTLWLARMGSPAYVGRGEKAEIIQIHTQENLQQIRETAAKVMEKEPSGLHIHVTTLNTYSSLEHQSLIIDNVYKATRAANKGDNVSYVPTNIDGTFRFLDIAPGLNFANNVRLNRSAPLQKANRLENVSKVILAASNTVNTISLVHCASGQDRTGTAIEKVIQDWMKQRYAEKKWLAENIDHIRAEGGNAAEITTHYIQGSPGMKIDSKANNYFGNVTSFSKEASKEMYLASAETNKQNKVNNVTFLNKTNKLAIEEYESLLATFERSLEIGPRNSSNPHEVALYSKGKFLHTQIKKITGNNQLAASEFENVSQILRSVNKGLIESNNLEKTKTNVQELATLAQNVSGKSSSKWKALGFSLLTFASLALVVVGVLAAIPSGGSSLLLAAIGAAGITASTAAAASAATAGIVGTGALIHGREKGLAQEVSVFKKKLKNMQNTNEKEINLQPSNSNKK